MEDYTATDLHALTKVSIENAFRKVKRSGFPEDLELKLLTKDMQESAVLFMKDNFVPDEPLAQIFGVKWDEDAGHYWRAVFKQGMSLVLTNTQTDEIIALRGIEIVNKSDRVSTENILDERLRNLLNFLNYNDDHAKFFEHYTTEEAVYFAGLAVSDSYRRRGIATLLLTSAVEFVENFGLENVYIKAEASSDYSKKIYKKIDFETLFEQMYEHYDVNSKQVLNKIDHKSNKVYGKHITCLK